MVTGFDGNRTTVKGVDGNRTTSKDVDRNRPGSCLLVELAPATETTKILPAWIGCVWIRRTEEGSTTYRSPGRGEGCLA
ncbi:unnamed protein product [Linum trigynum]|uniref:Uncharacterized protein n=1 Tax=Linum trigynum TaxID=586398 RepID=A0AAV2FUY4_9ROSI